MALEKRVKKRKERLKHSFLKGSFRRLKSIKNAAYFSKTERLPYLAVPRINQRNNFFSKAFYPEVLTA
jgi:hypothetical protein